MYTLVVLLDTVRNTIISIHPADVCHGINQVNVAVEIVRYSIHWADVVITNYIWISIHLAGFVNIFIYT